MQAALDVRVLLQELGLPSWIKTTGLKGFHSAVPLDAKAHFGTVAHFAHRAGTFRKLLVARDPANLTREFLKVIAAAAFSSTPLATTTARRSPLLTPFVPDQAPLCRRPAPRRK